MVDSAYIYFIQHSDFADIYFSESVCISVCEGYQVSRTYCQVSFLQKDVCIMTDSDSVNILGFFLYNFDSFCLILFIFIPYNYHQTMHV